MVNIMGLQGSAFRSRNEGKIEMFFASHVELSSYHYT
jgi:hypothetical protein